MVGAFIVACGNGTAPSPGMVAPRSARHLGMESTRMEWGGVTQGGRTRGPNPTGRTPSQPVRSALHGHAQSWADEAGAREEAGGVMEPRHGERGGREESPPGGGVGKADGLHAPEGRSPGRARARVQDPTGVARARGRARCLRGTGPAWGSGCSTALAWAGASTRARARTGDHEPPQPARDSGRARPAPGPARGQVAV